MDIFKAAALQFETKPNDKKANLLRAERLLDKAAKENVKLAVFSEYCWTGYLFREAAEPIPGGIITEELSKKAKEHSMYIVTGSIIEKEGGDLFHTCALIDTEGEVIGKQQKTSLIPKRWAQLSPVTAMKDEEGLGLKHGKTLDPIKTELGVIGILVGADNHPPEAARTLVLKGAEILTFSVAVDVAYLEEIAFFGKCRAFENSAYVISADRVGVWKNSPAGDLVYAGNSAIINPKGEILSSAVRHNDDIAIAEINMRELREFRKDYNMAAFRYPKVYDLKLTDK